MADHVIAEHDMAPFEDRLAKGYRHQPQDQRDGEALRRLREALPDDGLLRIDYATRWWVEAYTFDGPLGVGDGSSPAEAANACRAALGSSVVTNRM